MRGKAGKWVVDGEVPGVVVRWEAVGVHSVQQGMHSTRGDSSASDTVVGGRC
jgi:hypothetical protein